ncbi:MAG: GntR family transcriptional regulator [Clostridia bacterium]|nr:GntR family transcriptional regulator [Clostridia bacterium]
MPAKYELLADAIESELSQYRKDGVFKLPSEAALTARYKVSRQTVRHALSLLADRGLIQSRRGSGYYICKTVGSNPHKIDVIITHANEYIFPALLEEVGLVLAEYGYEMTVHATENSLKAEREILLSLLKTPNGGILAEGSRTALPNPNVDLYEQLQLKGVPTVFLHGAHAALKDAVCVGDDNFGGGYMLTKYLIDKGHRRIAGIFKSDDVQGIERYHGYMDALRDARLLPEDRNILWFTTEERETLNDGLKSELMERFLLRHLSDCTAVVCYNDEVAYRLIKALTLAKKRVPNEVAVVSFDNSYYCELSNIPITSLSHRPMAMSRCACDTLIRMIRGQTCASHALLWDLAERESSKISYEK